MTKRDLIIVSVLLNAGILAVLFLTAIKTDPDGAMPSAPSQESMAANEVLIEAPEVVEPPKQESQPIDEVDLVLREYLPEVAVETVAIEQPPEVAERTDIWAQYKIVEVTVKKGDALEKIARANNATVESIKSINRLSTDKLKIGQVLKVPVGSATPKKIEKEAPSAKSEVALATQGEPQYYTIKSGDNPWKIAKQFHVKFEDLLKMNGLNEDSGRNLKVGDKIRVK